MKNTLKLVGPKGEKVNVDPGSATEKELRAAGYAEPETPAEAEASATKRGPGRPPGPGKAPAE